MKKNNISEIIEDIKKGKMVIIVDDESRENEGDLICAADLVTPEIINFMASKGKGLICLPMSKDLCEKYDLKMMTNNNRAANKTAFTVSIEAAEGITTGISAADRAHTIKTAVNKNSKPSDIVQPGHIFPLKAMKGGVLSRAGHTEAACDLAKIAGLQPAGVICEIMNDDGTMARRDDLIKFGQENDIKVGTIADLIDYRLSRDSTIESVMEKNVENEFGKFKLNVWRDKIYDEYHFSLTMGDLSSVESPLVRVQTQSILQDILGIDELGKNWSIRNSLKRIAQEGTGLFVLINHRDAKSYWLNKLEEREIEPKNNRRVIGVGSQILRLLDLKKITENYKSIVWIGMEYRYMPPVAKFIQNIHNNKIGDLKMLSIREHREPFLVKVNDWNRLSKNTGGTLVEKCCHFFDLMRYITKSDPIQVYASGGQDVNHLDEEYNGKKSDILDNAYVIVDFANKVRASLDLCMFAENSNFQEELSAVGTKGKIETGVPSSKSGINKSEVFLNLRNKITPDIETIEVDNKILQAGHHHGSTYYEHLKFLDCIKNKSNPEVSLNDGLIAVATGEAAEKSIKENRVVKMSEFNL